MKIDQVSKFSGKFNEGYFCMNTVQPLHFAFKSSVIGNFPKKCEWKEFAAINRRYLKTRGFFNRTPNVFARFVGHPEFLYLRSLALGMRQRSTSIISMLLYQESFSHSMIIYVNSSLLIYNRYIKACKLKKDSKES